MYFTPLLPEHAEKICEVYGIGRPRGSSIVGEGVLNCNYVLETDTGKYFIKSVREKATPRIPSIYGIESWMKASGIPAVVMCTTNAGEVALSLEGHVYTLYPFIESEKKKIYSEHEFATMGAMLGRIHVLSRFNISANLSPKEFKRPGKREITERLQAYKTLILNKIPDETDKMFLGYIDFKLSAIPHATDPEVTNDTITHGDFHPGNLLFRGSEIIGVCDWEKSEFAPRSYELARSLLYSCFEGGWPLERAFSYAKSFLEGYLSVCQMDSSEFRKGLEMKFYRTVLSSWLEEMYYKQGTSRANHFVAHEMELIRLFLEDDLAERIALLVVE